MLFRLKPQPSRYALQRRANMAMSYEVDVPCNRGSNVRLRF